MWSLQQAAGKLKDPEARAPFQRMPLGDALERLSRDDASEIAPSVRRAALGALAANEDRKLPDYDQLEQHYRQYAARIAEDESAGPGAPPGRAPDPQQIAEEEALWAKDACTAQNVIADDHRAVWVYGRLATPQSLDQLAQWVHPENWVKWGKPMFQSMEPLEKTPVSGPPGAEQWHARYRERVSLAGKPLSTILSFDFKRTLHWVGMSYDLDRSEGNDLVVDRGFLLAHDYGDHRMVEALKIAGFVDPSDNLLISMACPLWTVLLREAVGQADAKALAPRHQPTPSGSGSTRLGLAANAFDPRVLALDIAQQWGEHISGAGKFYGEFVGRVGSRLTRGGYRGAEVKEDGSLLFMRVASDWARAWQATMGIVDKLVDAGHADNAIPPPVDPQRPREVVQILVPQPEEEAAVAATDFNRIHVDPATVPSRSLAFAPTQIGPGQGYTQIDVTIDTATVPSGLYEGSVTVGRGQGQRSVDTHFYVAKTRPGD